MKLIFTLSIQCRNENWGSQESHAPRLVLEASAMKRGFAALESPS